MSEENSKGRGKLNYIFFYETCLGRIGIGATELEVTNLYLGTQECREVEERISGCQGTAGETMAEIRETCLIKEAFRQLNEYLEGERRTFQLPLNPAGTAYQRKVWDMLLRIPYGKTSSYKEIAEAVGNAKAARAVGMANNRNPIPIFIPCHRVIGSDGSMKGYYGGIDMKRRLLEIEGAVKEQEIRIKQKNR
ncbi:methylated-DNA-[protein]-cysteine S-methyltransferase [Anaerobium acetethylicum]|uniref:Methylated-DNA--protein-cysteine methyltransferase n=1 Tax=Anaerobium acetethylicum TaxID=1619234 RepID=A0A1D3TQ28_9FIRM|nr:methylated-DNA-[protein]-cysteine S-methyltransferase [Anaerobium acetethylicum]